MKKQGYDVKLIDHWTPPEGDDLRPLVAMPNIPKPLHLVNAPSPILVILFDIVTLIKLLQSSKACCPILVTLFGRVTLVMLSQP